MLRNRISGLGLAAVLFASLGVSGCSDAADPTPTPNPIAAPQVALTLDLADNSDPIRIGLLAASVGGPGAEYRAALNGARIASYRFGLSGAEVELIAVADDGSQAGALRAVQKLADQQIDGVVVGAVGAHLDAALEWLSEEQIPALLAYDYGNALPNGVWRTGPSAKVLETRIGAALADAGLDQPLVITDGRLSLQQTGTQIDFAGDAAAAAAAVATSVAAGEADSLVVAADAATAARLVYEVQIQLGARQLPVVLSPEAMTATFASNVGEVSSLRSVLISVGQDTGDQVVLRSDNSGERAAGFFQAMQMAADDSNQQNIFGDGTFASVSGEADVASYDATVALVRAVEDARNSGLRVVDALGGLQVTEASGLVGADLSFATDQPLPAADVQVLYASSQEVGVRPANATGPAAKLSWMVVAD